MSLYFRTYLLTYSIQSGCRVSKKCQGDKIKKEGKAKKYASNLGFCSVQNIILLQRRKVRKKRILYLEQRFLLQRQLFIFATSHTHGMG